MNLSPANQRPKRKKNGGLSKSSIYRQCRLWHGYLSAFAFIALVFFSITGIMLNHPTWFATNPDPLETVVMIPPATIRSAMGQLDRPEALAAAVSGIEAFPGRFTSGELVDGLAFLRFEGVKGDSDISIDLETGEAALVVLPADFVTQVNELHRGVKTGNVWRMAIDIAGGLVLILSLIGYILFFTLKFRLATSLMLTAGSVAGMITLFVFCVP